MSHPELFLLGAARALIEVALLALLGQGVLALLAGAMRQGNPVYRMLQIITQPVLRLARKLAPPLIVDTHLPFVAFFLLFWLWIGLAYLKRIYCEANFLQC